MTYRYDHRTAASSHYGPLFHELVAEVDEVAEALKKADHMVSVLHRLEDVVQKDTEFLSSEAAKGGYGLNAEAPKQHIESMRRDVEAFRRAAKQLVETYDQMNASFLRLGLK